MKNVLKRGMISFFISSFAGLLVNLSIDCIVNAKGEGGFISMVPDFVAMFPTPVIAAYVNIMLYGLIGFTFSVMTFVYDIARIGFVIQSIIYFVVTASVCITITVVFWQMHKYPEAFISTLSCYAVTHVIMITVGYNKLKKDIKEINEISVEIAE